MGFGAAGGGACAGTSLYAQDRAIAGDAFQARQHVEEGSHVGRLFLHPDDVGVLAVAVEFGGDFLLGEGIELFEEDDRRGGVFPLLSFRLKFVADFSGADQDAVGFSDFGVGNDVQEILVREVFDGRTGVGMAQHALRREDDQRLAPVAQCLPAQEMEILRGVRGLAIWMLSFRGELNEALDAGAGVLRTLAFVAVRQQHHEAGEQIPLVFSGADELVDDDLGDVDEVAELRFPEDERFGIVAAVAVFEAEDSGFGERGVVDFATRLVGRDVFQRHVFVLVLDVDEDGVALIEGAAAGVLSAQADVGTGFHQAGKGESLGHAVIHGTLACAHLGALFEQLLHLGVNVEAFGIRGQALGELGQLFRR